MGNPKYQTRLPSDTADEVETYMDEHDISQAEAIRRLVEAGIESKANEGELQRAAGQNGTLILILILGLLSFVLQAVNLLGGVM